jgi:hypothetical protein
MGSAVHMIRFISLAKQCLIIELWHLFASCFGFMAFLGSFKTGMNVCLQKGYVPSLQIYDNAYKQGTGKEVERGVAMGSVTLGISRGLRTGLEKN